MVRGSCSLRGRPPTAAKLLLDQTTNTSSTCYGGVGHDGALSQEITCPTKNADSLGANVMNPSLNHLKVKTQDGASEVRVRGDQRGGRIRKEHVLPRRQIRLRCYGAHVAIVPYLDLDPILRGISSGREGVRRRILQLAVILLLRQTNNKNVTRGNVVVESTPRENRPRSFHGSRGMGIPIDGEYLLTPRSVAKAGRPHRGPVQTLPAPWLLDVNSAVERRLAERSDCEKDSKAK